MARKACTAEHIIGMLREAEVRLPGVVDRRVVYAIYVQGSAQEPCFSSGDILYVDPRRQPANGDDVLVYLAGDDSAGGRPALVKTLNRRDADSVELLQYLPMMPLQIPASMITEIHRVIPWNEIAGV